MTRIRALLVLVAAVVALVAVPGGAGAQDTEPWTITGYDVAMAVDADGTLEVTERIDLDFGTLQRRGIFRYIPVWEDLPTPLPPELEEVVPEGSDPSDYQRVLRIEDIRVTSASGAPTDLQIQGPDQANGNVQIRIGDPDVTVSGAQQYTIAYRVRGAVEPLSDGAGLAWDAVGTGWPVPIQRVTVQLTGPGIQQARCLQGPAFATDACSAAATDGGAQYQSSAPLAPYEGMTISARFAAGALDAPPILVEEKPGIRRWLIGSAASVPLSGAAVLLGGGLLGVLGWRQGRDRQHRGGLTSHGTVDEHQAGERRRGLFEPRPVPVEYRPPDGLRPAQLGLIIDERVDAVDVTATLVDLAVRGHLTIEEIQKSGWFRRADWELVRADPPPDDPLQGYEKELLDGLFQSRSTVEVSELKGTFASDYQRVEAAIYSDGQGRRWFADRPDQVRSRWLGSGVGLVVLGGVATFFLGQWFDMGLVGLGVAVLGLVLMATHRLMPRRTGRGSALLTRTLGFREFVEQAEADRMAFAEVENLFVEYLPYAVVFGCVEKWAQVFEDLGVDLGSAVGGFYVGPGPFHLMAFSSGMNDFSSSVGSAVIAAPPSSSGGGGFSGGGGGFSGGGMGGGGGGSW